jgi:hypothetical protein
MNSLSSSMVLSRWRYEPEFGAIPRQIKGEAVELIAETDALNMRAQGLLSLAEVLAAADREEEASERAGEAVRRYEAKGNLVMAERAAARLAELQPSETAAERA